jgi:hypothetical protein
MKVRFSLSLTDAAGELIAGGFGIWEDAANTAKPALIVGFGSMDAANGLPLALSGIGTAVFTAHDTPLTYAFSGGFQADTWYYLRFRRDGTLYYLDWSTDGQIWTVISETTNVSNLATVGHIGLALVNKNLGVAFDIQTEFFRYRDVADGTTDPVYGTSVNVRLFTGLLDTPITYEGAGGQLVAVKDTETGLEFIDPPQTGITVQEIDGAPNVSAVTTIRVTNGTLTDDGGGQVTVDAAAKFTDLNDVPSDYTGHAGEVVAVKATEDGLEFTTSGAGSGDMTKAVYDADEDGVVDAANAVDIVGMPIADNPADGEALTFAANPYWSGSEPTTEEGPTTPVSWTGQYNHYDFYWYVDWDSAAKVVGGTFTIVGGRNFRLFAYRGATEVANSPSTNSAGPTVTLTFTTPLQVAAGETIRFRLYQDNDSDFAYLNASTWDGDTTHWHNGDWGCGPIGHLDFKLPSSIGTAEWGTSKMAVSVANVSNPPTDAELDTAFGAPATVGAGFVRLLDDAGGHANEYLVWSDGANWWHVAGTKAV